MQSAARRVHLVEPDRRDSDRHWWSVPGYVWCFPLANGRVNVGFGIERTAQVKTKTMKALWASLAERPHIRAVLGPDAVAEEDVRAWPIPADIAHATLSDGRVLFIGDAARGISQQIVI